VESKGLDIVEGSAPSETEKEIAHRVKAGNVGAVATLDNFASTVWKKGKKLENKQNREVDL
jgi:hypothetical protein